MRSGNNLGICSCDEFSSVLGNFTARLYSNNQNKPLQHALDKGIRGTNMLNHVFHRLQEMELTLPKHLQKVYFFRKIEVCISFWNVFGNIYGRVSMTPGNTRACPRKLIQFHNMDIPKAETQGTVYIDWKIYGVFIYGVMQLLSPLPYLH